MLKAIILSALFLSIINSGYTQNPEEVTGPFGCNYTWKQSTYGANMGVNSMYSGDVDNDGICEMIFSANFSGWADETFWYVLEYNAITDNYDQVFISPASPYGAQITVIEVLDADKDGEPEIAVGHEDGTIEIWNALNFGFERKIILPVNEFYAKDVMSILAADGDNDGSAEFICCTEYNTYLYRIPSFEVKKTINLGDVRLRCGNINSDTKNELIYGNGRVYTLTSENDEPVQVTQLIPLTNEYMNNLELYDVDNDQKMEVLISAGPKLWLMDGTNFNIKFSYTFEEYVRSLEIADVDSDGEVEIIAGEYSDAQMKCFEVDGTEVWTLNNGWDGISGITVNDLDNDGSMEIMWGSGYGVTDEDYIYVNSVPDLTEEWKSEVFYVPYTAVEVGDVDGDGAQEVVTVEAEEGTITINDATSKKLEWKSGWYYWEPYDLKLFDIDKDGLSEIIICGQTIRVLDGVSHEQEPQFPIFSVFDSWEYRWLEIVDIDKNGTYEYVISNGYHTIIADPSDGGILWDSNERSGDKFYDFAVGNIDNDQELEIITNKSTSIHIYDVPNGKQDVISVSEHTSICLYDYNKDNRLDIMACMSDGTFGYYDGVTLIFTQLPYNLKKDINHLKVFDYPTATGPVIAFVYNSKVCFSDNTGRFSHEWLIGDDTADEMDISDYNNDGYPELFVLANTMITEIDLSCFLPVAIAEKEITNTINIYPNPASDVIVAELPAEALINTPTGELYDMRGVKVASFEMPGKRVMINCQGLTPGMYLVKIGPYNNKLILH